jgi:hypothetical protein
MPVGGVLKKNSCSCTESLASIHPRERFVALGNRVQNFLRRGKR